jgi:hypothetical protein
MTFFAVRWVQGRVLPSSACPVFGGQNMAYNGWVFVSGFALHNAQFKRQMLMAKLAQIPCYKKCG